MTIAAEPTTVNVTQALRRRAAEAPQRLAVRGPDGRSITFGRLEERCDALAREAERNTVITSAGIGPQPGTQR